MHELSVKVKHEVDKGFELTEKLNLWDHQKSAEAAHTNYYRCRRVVRCPCLCPCFIVNSNINVLL
jgi:hypothetical protein